MYSSDSRKEAVVVHTMIITTMVPQEVSSKMDMAMKCMAITSSSKVTSLLVSTTSIIRVPIMVLQLILGLVVLTKQEKSQYCTEKQEENHFFTSLNVSKVDSS